MASAMPTAENAFAYRKALRADCTCNGRSPSGLAPVDLTLDTSLRSGDVVATTDGLVAYTGVRLGADQTAEFTPVASYPGLTADVRARLGEMKVAPVSAEMVAANAPLPETSRDVELPTAYDTEGGCAEAGETGGSAIRPTSLPQQPAAIAQAVNLDSGAMNLLLAVKLGDVSR